MYLEIIGKNHQIGFHNSDSGRVMRIFEDRFGKYKITFNEDDKPCLWKTFSNSSVCLPCIDEEYIVKLKEGKTVLIDEDVVKLKELNAHYYNKKHSDGTPQCIECVEYLLARGNTLDQMVIEE